MFSGFYPEEEKGLGLFVKKKKRSKTNKILVGSKTSSQPLHQAKQPHSERLAGPMHLGKTNRRKKGAAAFSKVSVGLMGPTNYSLSEL